MTSDSRLANLSGRGFVQTGNDVMIGGFILGNGTAAEKVIIRAIGPSLSGFGIPNFLANPKLDLHDVNGTLLMSNDNWKESQQAAIAATGLAPQNDLESAVVTTLPPGNYTAVVSGVNSGTGVALVEVYDLP